MALKMEEMEIAKGLERFFGCGKFHHFYFFIQYQECFLLT